MFIYLPEVQSKDGKAVDYEFEKKLSDCFDDFTEGGSLNLAVSVSCSGDKVLVRGRLEVLTTAACSRCLEHCEHRFETDFTEAFTVVKQPPFDDSPDSLAIETANTLTVCGDYLYLDEFIRQLIILAQEYRPLCKPHCKGLCAGCGCDLNRASCRCSDRDDLVDARLLKLKELCSDS